MLIQKFGGTSVGSAMRMKEVAGLCIGDERRIVVLSAMSGTTNDLLAIASLVHHRHMEKANQQIDKLHKRYSAVAGELFHSHGQRNAAKQILSSHFDFIRSFTLDIFTVNEEKAVLAQGELLSTALFTLLLEEMGINAVLLPALSFMRIDEQGEPDLHYISTHLSAELKNHPACNLFVTQGYICRNAFGEVDNLKRGGSDYTATLLGAALHAREIQIWTDIDGMHNNDPRYVPKTTPIAELTFEEAAELAYFGAKILHPTCVLPARLHNVPVRLLNTMQPAAAGTLIRAGSKSEGIRAVAAKDNITAINIKSGRMLLAYGFLRSVFEVFERWRTPIDMITTSEVAVSLTIDNDQYLGEILRELSAYGSVGVDRDLSIICIVGDFAPDSKGYASLVFDALRDIPVRMISHGGSANNISVLVSAEMKVAALMALHTTLFEKDGRS